MAESNKIYGIDLGTTYSCIACVDEHGKPVVYANSEGHMMTPSVVYFERADNIVVGQTAKDVAELYPDLVVSTVKRVMGDPDWVFEHEGHTHLPQDVSSYILRKLVSDAEVLAGEKITDVVITCPAYFGVTQKEATRQAGTLAGLNVRFVIPEPTAAAIAYSIGDADEEVILVYDLGGGTFDVTVIEVKKGALTVICTGGNHNLGGKNWDEAIANYFANEFSNATGVSAEELTGDPETWQELMKSAEAAKIALSSKRKFERSVQFGGDRVKTELTRDKFDEITNHLLELTISLTEDVLEWANKNGHPTVNKLLFVGGSTYMPQVTETVKTRFPFECHRFDPNQAVAKGAAIFGLKCSLDEQIKIEIESRTGRPVDDVKEAPNDVREAAERVVANQHGLPLPGLRNLTQTAVSNVTSKSFGIVVMDADVDQERVNNLIVMNDVVPRTVKKQFVTYSDNQTGVTLTCMENSEIRGAEDPLLMLESSVEVGVAELKFMRGLPKGSPIEVIFSLSNDGLLVVYGKDLTTDQEIEASFSTSAILRREEVDERKSRNMKISVS